MMMLSDLDTLTLSDNSNVNVVIKDNVFSDISDQVFGEVQRLRCADSLIFDDSKRIFSAAGIGKGDNNQINSVFRSDLRCWLTPDLCKEHNLVNIEHLIKKLIKTCSSLKTAQQLNGDYSAQLTLYPGNGTHYVRHLDTFQVPSSSSTAKKSHRRITLLYYLNQTCEGGQLRVYPTNDIPIDIEPAMNRLVLFRSDKVEHEVLPCYSDRIAISLWASSSLPPYVAPNLSTNSTASTAAISSTNPPTSSPHSTGISPAGPPPLTLPPYLLTLADHPYHSATIFVSMVNYRDSEGPRTITDLFRRAAHPERIFLGTVFQGDTQVDGDCCRIPSRYTSSTSSDIYLSSHIRTLSLPHQQARGPCFARHLALSLWQGEQYFLQIDSHMRFRDNWDTYLIHLLESIKSGSSSSSSATNVKPVLTTYPLGYTLPNNVPDDIRPTILIPTKFDDDGILRQTARVVEPASSNGSRSDRPPFLKSPLWASGFSFSDSSLINEVPYNPHLHYLFFGEEVSMAARMFTYGYDFYAPTENVLYHLYSRAHRPTFQEVQPPNKEMLKAESQKSVRRLLGMSGSGDAEKGTNERLVDKNYGLGTVRSLHQFEESVGVRFNSRTVDTERDWDFYINACSAVGDGLSVQFRFVNISCSSDSSGGSVKDIEELFTACSGSGTISAVDSKEDGLNRMLKALAGLDRVKEFLHDGV